MLVRRKVRIKGFIKATATVMLDDKTNEIEEVEEVEEIEEYEDIDDVELLSIIY